MAECRLSELMSWRAGYSGNARCVESMPTTGAWPASLATICHTSRTDELRTGSLIKDAGTEMERSGPSAGSSPVYRSDICSTVSARGDRNPEADFTAPCPRPNQVGKIPRFRLARVHTNGVTLESRPSFGMSPPGRSVTNTSPLASTASPNGDTKPLVLQVRSRRPPGSNCFR